MNESFIRREVETHQWRKIKNKNRKYKKK